MEQNTSEWHAARVGKLTASRFHDAVAKLKNGSWGASRANYMAELIAERVTGEPYPHYSNQAMQWGNLVEADARAAYSFYADVDVVEVGFIGHPIIEMSGCSPDGLVGDDGLVEFKCPNTATHIDTLLGAQIDRAYHLQMMWQMACTGRKWCDWVSFDPRLPERLRLYVERVTRHEDLIANMERDASVFLAELQQRVEELEAKRPARIAA